MKLPQITVAEIARLTNGRVEGAEDLVVTGAAPIMEAGAGELSFIAQPRFLKLLAETTAAAVFVDLRSVAPPGVRPVLIRVANPYFAFVEVIRRFAACPALPPGVHPSAQVAPDVRLAAGAAVGPLVTIEAGCEIGEGAQIGAQCHLGRGTRIGAHTILFPGVRIGHEVTIGANVIIQFGAVVGSDGFGYVRHEGRYHKIPHLGTVVIEDDVEIGANCCIDRGTFGETRVKQGAKLDNLIQLAHNVVVGEHTVIAAQTGISGSTTIGRDVTLAGQVGLVGHIQVGDRAVCAAQAGVTKSVAPGATVSGYPARDHAQAKREEAAIRRLPELLKRVRALEKLLAVTPAAAHGAAADAGENDERDNGLRED